MLLSALKMPKSCLEVAAEVVLHLPQEQVEQEFHQAAEERVERRQVPAATQHVLEVPAVSSSAADRLPWCFPGAPDSTLSLPVLRPRRRRPSLPDDVRELVRHLEARHL